jgi:hypothetical protein
VLKIRRDDIIRRRDAVTEFKTKRKELIDENNRNDDERKRLLEEAKKFDENENPIEVNEEEVLKEFNETHHNKEVPEDINYDLDEDYEMELLDNSI